VTVPVGSISPEMQKLLDVTRESLDRAIDKMRAGQPPRRRGPRGAKLGRAARIFGGARVRRARHRDEMHDEPNLPNYGMRGHGARLQEGMVIAVEPMVNAGRPEVRMRDEWVAETADGSPRRTSNTPWRLPQRPWILTRPKEMTGPSW